ncbi:MAG: hypothetical protein LBD23_06565, partial [Oscillospiraceae bacterium]|nr:hypothetical protein [Oscillospiraceae bacterium]
KDREEFWTYISNSHSVDLPGFVYAEEINIQKDYVLNVWYKNKEHQDISSNTVRTYEVEMDFIKTATEFITQVFTENL